MSVFLIVCPLVFLAGFVDAIAGGGGLISLPAYMIAGLPAHAAIATNKLSACMGTSIATWRFWKNGFIPFKEVVIAVPFAVIGSWLGAELALWIAAEVFQIILLVILPITAAYVMLNKKMGTETPQTTLSFKKTMVYIAIIAFFIGIYDGFYGPGTGTFFMLLLTGIAKMSLQKAAGTTKVMNLTTNVIALVVYIMNGKVLLILGLVAGIFSILGNYIGSQCFTKSGVKLVKPIMIVVLCIFFVKTISELFL